MKLKKVILCFLALCILVCTCGCGLGNKEIERDGVEYDKRRDNNGDYYLSVTSVGWDLTESLPLLYIPPEIDGIPVKKLGTIPKLMGDSRVTIGGVEKLYFPWTITGHPVLSVGYNINYVALTERGENGKVEYTSVEVIISSSVNSLIDRYLDCDVIFVFPNYLYHNCQNDDRKIVGLTDISNVLPANIALMFNYADNPNEGYFFVDLLEESGKLTKPPYDPKRDGYKFAGWYKEAECLNVWDFENDIVKINFDEEGNRIYEEFCLYAKWVKK